MSSQFDVVFLTILVTIFLIIAFAITFDNQLRKITIKTNATVLRNDEKLSLNPAWMNNSLNQTDGSLNEGIYVFILISVQKYIIYQSL